ncbi:hypothetical protein [Serratia ureilytica]|uniref:hypothetical protein n=1 Tax=Serratia ureilytica TaxID=300181 RepID=UPI00313D4C98
MGIALFDNRADLSDRADFIIPPVRDGLLAWGHLGGSLERSLLNLARFQPGFGVVGNPEVKGNYLRFKSGTDFLRTSVFQRKTHTLFCVARSDDTFADDEHKPMLMGTFSGQNVEASAFVSHGLSLFINTNNPGAPQGKLTAQAGVFKPAAPATSRPLSVSVVRDMSMFGIMSVTCTESTISVKDWVSGTVATNPFPTGTTSALSSRAFAIGSPADETKSLKGYSDMAAFVIYEGVLTESEQSLVVGRLRTYCNSKGISLS